MNSQLSFEDLNDISLKVVSRFDLLQKHFGLDVYEQQHIFSGRCPIHKNSDNPTAFHMYKNSGIWRCNTQNCHQHFKASAIGFVRALLSRQMYDWDGVNNVKMVSFPEAILFIEDLIKNAGLTPIGKSFYSNPKYTPPPKVELAVSIKSYLQHVKCPAEYYINRQFDSKILEQFKVGLCTIKGKQMYNRVVVPIFNDEGSVIIGFTGRTIHEKCIVCGGFHDETELCVDPQSKPWMFQKWKNSKGFAKTQYLYNWWGASKFAQLKSELILVEGPSEVWKLETAGIYNGMAIFGSNLSYEQIQKINTLEITTIKVIVDNDAAGHKVYQQIQEKLPNYKVIKIVPPGNDLGEMNTDEITDFCNQTIGNQW